MSSDLLHPVCETCGRCEGIHKAVVGPKSPDGMHDVSTLVLACGHEQSGDDIRLSEGVVTLFQLQHPEYIEVAE